MFALIRFEIRKLVVQKKMLAGFLVVLAINALFLAAFLMRQRHPERAQHDVPQAILLQLFNAFVYTQTILAPCMYMLFPMILAITGAYLLGGEIEMGNLRLVLVRPVSRWQIVGAKFVILSVYAALLLSSLLGFSYLISACALKPVGELVIVCPVFGLGGTFIVHARDAAVGRLGLSYLLAVPHLMSVCAMALMFSNITRHFTSAAVLTTTVYFCSHVIGQIPLLSAIHPFLPTRYMPFWRFALLDPIPWDRMAHDATWTFAFIAGFLAVAVAFFNGRDI